MQLTKKQMKFVYLAKQGTQKINPSNDQSMVKEGLRQPLKETIQPQKKDKAEQKVCNVLKRGQKAPTITLKLGAGDPIVVVKKDVTEAAKQLLLNHKILKT